MPFPLRSLPILDRQCGSCTECCTVIGVKEIEKDNYESCEHICENGCGIYETRPESCRTFRCLWLQGLVDGDERRRPDNLGIIFTPNNTHSWMIVAFETRPGAVDENRYLIDRISEKKIAVYCIMFNNEGRRIIGPPHLLDKAQEILENYNKE